MRIDAFTRMAVASLSPGEGNAAVAATGGENAPLEEEAAVDVKDSEGVPVVAAGDGNGEAPVVEGVQAIAAEGNNEAVQAEEEEGVKWLKHYSSMQSILIVGDGDFSFSLALATAFGSGENLVATSLDSYATLKSKYSKAESNIMELKRMGATVLHGVNAKTMKLHTDLKMRWFDRIVFNFPHAGFKGKEDQVHMINSHKELVRVFFYNARHLLGPYGEIHVSHKTGRPYDKWDIEQLASESNLIMVEKVRFKKEDYPGYNQKRGDSAKCDQPFNLGACCTFKFFIGDIKKLKKVRGNRIGSISPLGSSKVRPDILATDRRPFHLLPPVPAWPRPHFPPAIHTVGMPITLEPYPHEVARRQQTRFPVNFDGIVRAPYFHQQGTIRPMFRIPEPLLNVLPTLCGIPPPISRITSSSPHQEQPWYHQRPILDPLGRGDYSYFAREHQRSLQREYEIHRQVMPGGTSLGYSVFLEHRFRESAEKQEWLRRMIALDGRQDR